MVKSSILHSAAAQNASLTVSEDDTSEFSEASEVFGPSATSECAELVKRAVNAEVSRQLLPRLKSIVAKFPDELEPKLSYALVMEMTRTKEGMLEVWTSVHERFPANFTALQYRLRWLARLRQVPNGREILEQCYPGAQQDFDSCLKKAELLAELRDVAEAKCAFETLVRDYPAVTLGLVHYAKRLREWGDGERAWQILAPIMADPALPKSAAVLGEELRQGLAVLNKVAPNCHADDEPIRVVALRCAIETFRNRTCEAIPAGRLGSVALITGSLAAGGAERQLAHTAARLERARKSGLKIAGRTIAGPFRVLVKSLAREDGHDFFLPMITGECVESRQIDNMTPIPYSNLSVEDPDLKRLLPFMPSNVAYGVQRLVNYFREDRTEVAYFWQDGAVLFGALAALIAGVPRVVLSVRGLPPILRPHRYRIEYGAMYQTLAKIPGVQFMSNSIAAAHAYSEWLDLAPSCFAVVYNGVERLPPEPRETDEERWCQFERRTLGATQTIGSVFRAGIDKRPLLWVEFARDYLRKEPGARFVLVGSGPLFSQMRQLATEWGIADRILFVGRSSTVGYWLTKMGVLVLLSRFEGLPNVLIEAQVAGVPVVSTPAGGACEAFVPGVTGLAADSVEDIDMDSLCAKVRQVAGWSAADRGLPARIQMTALKRFSTDTMIERTVALLTGDDGGEDAGASIQPKRTTV